MATATGVDVRTICRDLDWLKALWAKELLADPVEQRSRDLAALDQLEKDAATKYLETKEAQWWDRVLKAQERRAKLLGLDAKEVLPGATPANPLYVAQVGYDINAVMDDPEIRAKVLELHQLIQAKTGGEGLIIEGEGGVI